MSAIQEFNFSEFIGTIRSRISNNSENRLEKNMNNLKSIFDQAAAADNGEKAEVLETDFDGFDKLVQEGLKLLRSIHVKDHEEEDVLEGDYAVQDGKTFKFTKGEWKEIQTNNTPSRQPKAPEVYNPDLPPEGQEGDFAVSGSDTYRFRNGQWVQISTQ